MTFTSERHYSLYIILLPGKSYGSGLAEKVYKTTRSHWSSLQVLSLRPTLRLCKRTSLSPYDRPCAFGEELHFSLRQTQHFWEKPCRTAEEKLVMSSQGTVRSLHSVIKVSSFCRLGIYITTCNNSVNERLVHSENIRQHHESKPRMRRHMSLVAFRFNDHEPVEFE